jgi:hypothetical protein
VNEGLDDDARGDSASRAMAGADAAILIPSAKRFMYHLLITSQLNITNTVKLQLS